MPPVLELLARTRTPHRVTTYGENTEQEPLPIALKECLSSIDLEVDARRHASTRSLHGVPTPANSSPLATDRQTPAAHEALANQYREL